MKRREFIQKSGGTLAALSLYPLIQAKPLQDEDKPIQYKLSKSETKYGEKYMMYYTYELPQEANNCEVDNFKLNVRQVSDNNSEQKCVYSITVKKCKNKGTLNRFKCKGYTLLSGPQLLRGTAFNPLITKKKSWLHLKPADEGKNNGRLIVLDRRKNELGECIEHVEVDYFLPGCYLTTVCVDHMGLPDNCYELQVLRKFRDNYLVHSDGGETIVQEYYKMAPIVVKRLQEQKESDAILTAMYQDLVLHCVGLIEEQKLEEAKDFYLNYSLTLQNLLTQ
jgi:hypothetical protein